MALATKCPHCNTIFRVAADQLKLRGGIVRCGSCQEVFDGNAALLDHAAPPAATIPTTVPAAPDEPVYALDFDTSYDPFGTLPEHAQLKAGPEPELPIDNADDAPDDLADAGDGRREPWFDAPDDAQQHYVASLADPYRDQDEVGHYYEDEGDAIEPDGAQADAPAVAGDSLAPGPPEDAGPAAETAVESEPEPESDAGHAPQPDEPAFVKQSRRRQRIGKLLRIVMAAGSVALLAALLAQGVTTFRNQLAAQVPQLKPALVSICGVLGCRVELPAQLDMVSIEQGELQTLSERTFSYATMLHNQSGSAQAWPSIELVLNDAADKAVLRRVIAPREYLPPTVDLGKGFAPRSEQAVKLYFELAQLKASGYHIAVFYP